MEKRILIIEDDKNTSNRIADALTEAGYICTQAFSGLDGFKFADTNIFSLITLDLTLPGIDGESLLPLIRSRHSVPIIVVSAKSALDDKIRLLTAGAEDYLTKPFEVEELVTRVNVQMRRFSDDPQKTDILQYRDLMLDTKSFSAFIAGHKLILTRQEFRILELMLSEPPGRVFSKHNFFEYAWESSYIGEDKTINVHISNIRKKLREFSDSDYIETVWGIGFRLAKQ